MEASALVVALDGPSGSGKSSVARAVAESLGLRYLDTGAMYRAVTWWMLRHGVDVAETGEVVAAAGKPQLAIGTDPVAPTVHVDGVDVSAAIRTREVSNAVSAVSAVRGVRERMVGMQREIIGSGGVVVEGRDIATVVAPSAPVKVFLTASSGERAQRRTRELAGEDAPVGPAAWAEKETREDAVSVDHTHAEMRRRDRLDSGRTASPLAKADDAVEIDTTELELEEVVGTVLRLVQERIGAQPA